MKSILKVIWHGTRPILHTLLGEKRLESWLFKSGLYNLKSRMAVRREEFSNEIAMWHRDSDAPALNEVLKEGAYDCAQVAVGDTVLDVGANIGSFSVLVSKRVGDTGKVYSFEPESENLALLKKNLEENRCQNVTAFPIGISDARGTATLHVREAPGAHSLMGGSDATSDIDVRTLDDLAQELQWGPVAVLKIDTEGAERKILAGAEKVLATTSQIVMETHPDWVCVDELKSFLTDRGFSCHDIVAPSGSPLLYCSRTLA